jgi:hypothetical protein
MGEIAKSREAIHRLAFLRRSSLDKDPSCNALYGLAVRRHYLWMKVRDCELRQILSQIATRDSTS